MEWNGIKWNWHAQAKQSKGRKVVFVLFIVLSLVQIVFKLSYICDTI